MRVGDLLSKLNCALTNAGKQTVTDYLFHSEQQESDFDSVGCLLAEIEDEAHNAMGLSKAVDFFAAVFASRGRLEWRDADLPEEVAAKFEGLIKQTVDQAIRAPQVSQPIEKDQAFLLLSNSANFERVEGEPDYESLAEGILLDENQPPLPSDFNIAPFLFNKGDKQELASRITSFVYGYIVARKTSSTSKRQNVNLRSSDRDHKLAFTEAVQSYNANAQHCEKPSIPFIDVKDVKSSFDITGFSIAATSDEDHSLYFDKVYSEWKDPGDKCRGYITLKVDELERFPGIFVNLCGALYSEGIDFRAKAASPKGFLRRADNIVLGIARYHKVKAEKIIADWIDQQHIQIEESTVGFPSEQKGLFWAFEPEDPHFAVKKLITGSTKRVMSYNEYVSCRVAPYYIFRLIEAHRKLGNHLVASAYENEIRRICGE